MSSGADDLRITSTASMRALAHPARLASLRHLMRVGPATATDLGETVGLTASAMSYHLRALERVGLIEAAPSRGDGRERLWQSTHQGRHGFVMESADDGDEETLLASVAVLEATISIEESETHRWMARSAESGWIDYGQHMTTTLLLNQAELTEVGRQIAAVFAPYTYDARDESKPADAVEMRAYFKAFPTA